MSKMQLFAAVFSILLPVAVMADVIHVPDDAATIQDGIDAASDGDTVLVADGTYTGDGNWDLDFDGKAIIVRSENGPENCIIDCMYDWNHQGFYFQHGEGHDSVVQGFLIRNIECQGPGGGIRCIDSSPTITDNWITESHCYNGGGGIYCSNSSPVISNNTISSHWSVGRGAGIHCENNSSPLIKDNNISGNWTDHSYGAGICCLNSTPMITGNTISGNINDSGWGHGIYCSGCSGEISDNMITGNGWISMTETYGGGIYCSGSSVLIMNNTITGNQASYSGGIYCAGSPSPTIMNNIIAGNNSEIGGGGIGCRSSSPDITNNLLMENHSYSGGGIYCGNSSSPTITSNTITGNTAVSNWGAGIYCDNSTPYVTNCILWGNTPDETGGDPLSVSYSDVQGGYPGVGNIEANPRLVDGPDGECCLAQQAAGQYFDSPCLDAGDDQAQNICYTLPAGQTCMNWLSTRTDGRTDTGMLDMGYHASPALLAASLTCTPSSGTLPFETRFTTVMQNCSLDGPRTGVSWIDVVLANGSTIDLWREGWQELVPGAWSRSAWTHTIPAINAVRGENRFHIHVVDVTPSPYNQPPCPPSGAAGEHTVLLTGFAP